MSAVTRRSSPPGDRGRSSRPAPASSVAAKPQEWFRFRVAVDEPDAVDIYVFDMIGGWMDDLFGWGDVTTAKTFLAELAKVPESVKRLRVHVNSPGGDCFSAVTIANMLRAESREKGRVVETSIEGLAASAATIITSAGDTIRIADNALMMIHNPWSVGIGEASDMRKAAEELDKVRDQIIATYRWVSSLSEEELGDLMNATTWMDAAEAVEMGFATEVVDGIRAAATFSPRALAKLGDVPAKYQAKLEEIVMPKDRIRAAEEEEEKVEDEEEEEKPEAKAAEEDDEEDEEDDEEAADGKKSNVVDFGKAVAALKSETRAEVKNLRGAVRDMCAAVRRPELADQVFDAALDGNLDVEGARAKLFDLMASASPEISNSTAPIAGAGNEAKPIIDAIVRGSKRRA
jgi:ATP-dependent protease ClpP protease subunit